MPFDPLELFSAPERKCDDDFQSLDVNNESVQLVDSNDGTEDQIDSISTDNLENDEMQDDGMVPLHIHDLPLLQRKPDYSVLALFLRLFSPDRVLNFSPLEPETDPETIFKTKDVVAVIEDALIWLLSYCPRFQTRSLLASVSFLAETLRKGNMSEYNGWLTQVIASELQWIEELKREEIHHLAALRLAENCGRTAQPEILRQIEIPHLDRALSLKEPSLTSDNLGLKTWGSSFLLGSRLAKPSQHTYLKAPVLELGLGTGLVGMVSCILGFETALTDLAEIVPNLRENVELNEINNALVDELDWLNPSSFLLKHDLPKYNTVILSDPLYSSLHPQWIVDMINLFLSDDKEARVLLQVPIRRNFERERASLWKLMASNGYTVTQEEIEEGHDDFGESKFIFKKYVRGSGALIN
ncbi:hypothetical protein PUMCH_004712 [Australozyma saopauloensis]|uniref:Protein-lysine N-methyltransferase EFM2 n=1 Tax=Australozyma saopauloensis TaxID=291208 RepID=A0AAX4HHK9_9ASCO|nr:hypothetical protein PUMCH_004712 [[Candida] saopauloensis]